MEMLEDCEKEEDDRFFYVTFKEFSEEIRKFTELASRLKGSKLWYYGNEVVNYYESFDTIFCIYRDSCNGRCKHNIDLYLGEHIDEAHPFYKEELAKNESVEGLANWFDRNREELEPNQRTFITLNKMNSCLIADFSLNSDVVSINPEYLIRYLEKKLEFQLNYCPIISKEKTLSIENKVPTEMKVGKYQISEEESDEEYSEEQDFLKKQAEHIGDEVEKRFRKVLSEFFDKK